VRKKMSRVEAHMRFERDELESHERKCGDM
jgi:hypothetical protein